MKKPLYISVINAINLVVFVILIAGFLFISLIAPYDERTILIENRVLNEMPEVTSTNIFDGSFSIGVDNYLADHIGGRSYLIEASYKIKNLHGIEPKKEAVLVVIESGDTILQFPNKLMYAFTFNEDCAVFYAETLNAYRALLGDNVKIYSMLIPTQIEFQKKKYKSITDSEARAIETVNKNLTEGIVPVDAYSALQKHLNEYIYFRTDHHWTTLGAYYAYCAFADYAGFKPVTIDKYSEKSLDGFLGYLSKIAPSDSINNSPDTIYYYEINEPITMSNELFYPLYDFVSYYLFIGGDQPIYINKTSVNNGKTIVIIKDSYANCFVPWVAPNYENIIVIDPRTFDGSVISVISEYEDVDLLFLDYVHATSMWDFIGKIYAVK